MKLLTWAILASAGAQAQCPVTIQHITSSSGAKAGLVAALAGGPESRTYLVVKYHNETRKRIDGVRFIVQYYNSVHELAYTDQNVTTTRGVKPGKTATFMQADEGYTNGERMGTTGWVARVAFSDGTFWNDDGTQKCRYP